MPTTARHKCEIITYDIGTVGPVYPHGRKTHGEAWKRRNAQIGRISAKDGGIMPQSMTGLRRYAMNGKRGAQGLSGEYLDTCHI